MQTDPRELAGLNLLPPRKSPRAVTFGFELSLFVATLGHRRVLVQL